jgi:hypothetical protein
MQVTCSVSRGITTTQASQRADTDTAPHAGSSAGRCRFPLMMLAKSKQPSAAAGLKQACPSASRTRPQTFNTTTSQRDEKYISQPSHHLEYSRDLCASDYRLFATKLLHPAPGASTRRDIHLALASHLTTTTRSGSLSRTSGIIVAANAPRKKSSAHIWKPWREHKRALRLKEDDQAQEVKADPARVARAGLASLARKSQKRLEGAVEGRHLVSHHCDIIS